MKSAKKTFHSDVIAKFKARAQKRHEKFNGKNKEFRLMQDKFHSPNDEIFAALFEAIAVQNQYGLEHGESLFDIPTGIEMEE